MLKHRILIPLLAVLLSTPAFADKPGGTRVGAAAEGGHVDDSNERHPRAMLARPLDGDGCAHSRRGFVR